MNDFQKKTKESFLKQPCPPWVDADHWNTVLNKVTFTLKGEGIEISYKGMSMEEIELLQGLVHASVANGFFTPQTRKARQPIVEKYQLEQTIKQQTATIQKHRKPRSAKVLALLAYYKQNHEITIKSLYADNKLESIHPDLSKMTYERLEVILSDIRSGKIK